MPQDKQAALEECWLILQIEKTSGCLVDLVGSEPFSTAESRQESCLNAHIGDDALTEKRRLLPPMRVDRYMPIGATLPNSA
ncbi:MAG: hypothetical protein WBG23_16725 [Acidobacteriaceae bacterium]|jgi:hypothetical protein